MSLLYVAGDRPGASDVARLLDQPAATSEQAALISHRPEEDEGWLELLASGLTFDISGLTPAAPRLAPAPAHLFGLPPETRDLTLEAVTISPGEHVASGAAMLPIVRVMCSLGARLASLGNVKGICWHPALSWMEPAYFARVISGWLAGGAFPALGLTALGRSSAGGIESEGLAFFVGQELLIDPRAGETPAATAKLAVRIIDLMVRQGPVREAMRIPGPDSDALLIEPSSDGVVRVRRCQ